MEKININSVKFYNDIRSLIFNCDLPIINVSLILEKISTEVGRVVDNELQRESQESDISNLQFNEDLDHPHEDNQENK